MNGCISVINSGSSSIKFSLYDKLEEDDFRLLFGGQVEGIGISPRFKVKDREGELLADRRLDKRLDKITKHDHANLLQFILGWIREQRIERGLSLSGVGHRVVHGGEKYTQPVVINDEVLEELDHFIPLAPLHQPHNLGTIRALMQLSPETPQVACFDTSFHTTTFPSEKRFGLPRKLHDEGIRRYGFHGLSYEYISRQFRQLSPDEGAGRIIAAHLGSGASMCAMKNGASVASSMGFSAMDGLVMGTRPGNIDPGVLLYLMEEKNFGVEELTRLLYKQSGLLGMSGISNDMRILMESDAFQAKEAIEVFLYRIQREIGALASVLQGLDSLIFTAGIGENSAEIREKVCASMGWLGLKLDRQANLRGDVKISTSESKISVWVIPTNEELMIATHTRDALLR